MHTTFASSQAPAVALVAQTLSEEELDQVSGGIVPAIFAGIALASHIGVGGTATTLTAHLISGASLAYAVYSAAEYYGSSGGTAREPSRRISSE